MFELKVIIFIAASIGITWVSRNSLRALNSHGFYRFLAWETILILILFNIDYWFHEPFSIRQIVSWLLLTTSLLLVIHGTHLLRMLGRPDSKRNDPLLLGIEKTIVLVAEGAYRYIRHPIYGSLLFLAWGVFFKRLTWLILALVLITTCLLTATAKKEEVENLRFWGNAYKSYMKKTKMFIPFIF